MPETRPMNKPQLENLTESLQKHLGIEQAQTFAPEDIVADAISRLTGTRGNVERLRQLWRPDTAHELVEGWRAADHGDALVQLRRVLDANLVVQRGRDGVPKTFRPLMPEMVNADKPSTLFRDLGRTVLDVLWRGEELREQLRARVTGWKSRHPLALALAPLCEARPLERSQAHGTSRLGQLLAGGEDSGLADWVRTIVAEDWHTWLRASLRLSIDEQIETMTALACLHLHVALLWRLWGQGERAIVFVAVAGQDMERACAKAAYNMYGFWGDRAYERLRLMAEHAVARARAVPGWDKLESDKDLAAWAAVGIDRGRSANARFQQRIKDSQHIPNENLAGALVDALVEAFSTESGVATKVKDYLRGTGRAVGLIGPDTYRARKRYQIDERAISLLARMHVHRETIHSHEDERFGVDALLDDVFHRYGLVVTRERGPIRQAFAEPSTRAIVSRFPSDEAMRRNRANLERRLDELRLVRRYSDASAVLHVV